MENLIFILRGQILFILFIHCFCNKNIFAFKYYNSFFQFDEQVFNKLRTEIDDIILNSENIHMKEVKGLGERLFGLDQLLRDAKNLVKQQGELAQAFLNVSIVVSISEGTK